MKNVLKLKLEVFSQRLGHSDFYILQHNKDGWLLQFPGIIVQVAKNGRPGLQNSLFHDSISYPVELDEYFEALWYKIHENKMSFVDAQKYCDQLSAWIIATEKTRPSHPYDRKTA
jgi:hypothetical protein